MAGTITPQEFRDVPGLDAWAVDEQGAAIVFDSKDFATGARFVARVAEIADELDHHPDVDLRYATVTVRTTSHDIGGLSVRDRTLAARVTEAARELGLAARQAGASRGAEA